MVGRAQQQGARQGQHTGVVREDDFGSGRQAAQHPALKILRQSAVDQPDERAVAVGHGDEIRADQRHEQREQGRPHRLAERSPPVHGYGQGLAEQPAEEIVEAIAKGQGGQKIMRQE